jgi:co-chaperonin GroES (HSP10)
VTDWTTMDWTTFRPLSDRVVLELDSDLQRTEAGLYVGAGRIQRNRVLWGTVKAAGRKSELKPGDRVCTHYGRAYKVLHERNPELILTSDEFCYASAPPGYAEPETWQPNETRSRV